MVPLLAHYPPASLCGGVCVSSAEMRVLAQVNSCTSYEILKLCNLSGPEISLF